MGYLKNYFTALCVINRGLYCTESQRGSVGVS